MNVLSHQSDAATATTMGSGPSNDANVNDLLQEQTANNIDDVDHLMDVVDELHVGDGRRRTHRSSHHPSGRKHRSLSSPRTTSSTSSSHSCKPKKSQLYLGSASASLTSIPNTIKLTMLNSGLLSVGNVFLPIQVHSILVESIRSS